MASRQSSRYDLPYGPKPARGRILLSIGLSLVLSIGLTVGLNIFTASFAGASTLSAQPVASSSDSSQLVDVVFDGAKVISGEDRLAINAAARTIFEDYGVAISVGTTNSTGGKSIEDWAKEQAVEHGGGSAELNNGLFYGIDMGSRQYSVVKGTGYSSIPDSELDSILAESFVPKLKEGRYADAVIESAKAFGERAKNGPAQVQEAPSGFSDDQLQGMGTFFTWFGIAIVGGIGIFISIFITRHMIQSRRDREEEARRADAARIKKEKTSRRIDAVLSLKEGQWKEFAKLPHEQARIDWLKDRGVYGIAFPGEYDWEDESLLEADIIDYHFTELQDWQHPSSAAFDSRISVNQQLKDTAARRKREEKARLAAEKKRAEERLVQEGAKNFWKKLSKSERAEYAALSSDRDRKDWTTRRTLQNVSDYHRSQESSNFFGLNPVLAIAALTGLAHSDERSSRSSGSSSSSSYRPSSSTDYSGSSSYDSSSMFGGGSFDGGSSSGSF